VVAGASRPSLTRVVNWQQVLADKIEEWRFRPFDYGSSDCWQFSGDVVLALTGIDYRDRFPRYQSCLQAYRILKGHGGMLGLARSVLGPEKHISQANEGDVVIGNFNHPTAGICLGVRSAFPGEKGLEFHMTSLAVAAWSI
jgi:hypothetical protein